MSFVVTVPEMVTAAAANLAGIGSTVRDAAAAAAIPTTGVAAAAADEVSIAVSEAFGSFGREFQAVSAHAAAFHTEFVSLVTGGAAAYLSAEIASGAQLRGAASVLASGSAASLASARIESAVGPALWTPSAAAAPGGAYEQLFVNTGANLRSLGSALAADPFPFLNQFLANQQRYFQQIGAAVVSGIQNLPANLMNLPAAVEAGIQGLVTFPFAQYTQQFITQQLAFAQAFHSSLNNAATGIVAGLPAFGAGLNMAFQTLLTGDFYGAAKDAGTALANLLITGFDVSNYTVGVNIDAGTGTIDITGAAFPVPLGPLPDFFTAIGVLGQDSQYLTNLTTPPILRHISQNFTNVLTTLSNPSIEAVATLRINPFVPSATGTLSGYFGLPVVLTYASVGPAITTLDGMAASATAVQQALLSGNFLGALGAVIDTPAVVTNSFLNGQVIEDVPIPVPLPPPLAPPLPTEILITLHLPFNGLLVPPHYATATVSTNSQIAIPGLPFDATIFGTPFMGLGPLLLNYVPQQLALAINPAA